MKSHVTHFEAAIDGTRLAADCVQTVHAGRPLWVRYDLKGVREVMSKEALRDRAPDLWRYRELLPVAEGDAIVLVGEGMMQLLRVTGLDSAYGAGE